MKHILFYSQFCEHCAEALRSLKAGGMREAFTLVCVDQRLTQIPSFVDRVPMILTSDRSVLADDEVFMFLRGSMHDPVAAEISGSFSDSFGVFQQNDVQDTAGNIRGYSQITGKLDVDFPRIYCPDDEQKSESPEHKQHQLGYQSQGRSQQTEMENIMSSREQDLIPFLNRDT